MVETHFVGFLVVCSRLPTYGYSSHTRQWWDLPGVVGKNNGHKVNVPLPSTIVFGFGLFSLNGKVPWFRVIHL